MPFRETVNVAPSASQRSSNNEGEQDTVISTTNTQLSDFRAKKRFDPETPPLRRRMRPNAMAKYKMRRNPVYDEPFGPLKTCSYQVRNGEKVRLEQERASEVIASLTNQVSNRYPSQLLVEVGGTHSGIAKDVFSNLASRRKEIDETRPET